MIKEQLLKHISILIEDGEILRKGDSYGQIRSQEHEQQCDGFLGRVYSFISQNLKDTNGYHILISETIKHGHGFNIPQAVGSLVENLKGLKIDIENGFLKGLESQISAEIFDTFLEHGEYYLKEGYKNEAGVIIGITFEDIVRKLARLLEIEENGAKIDLIISNLEKKDILSNIESKRARSSAALRTSAAHAKWDEFTKNDVEACLEFTKELISKLDRLQ